jgi:phosphoribosylformylglycinamidine cyclo-ligase
MNTDDLLCAVATDNMLLSSTIGRNKTLIPGEIIGAIINGTEDFLSMLRKHNINIISTGGETADVGDLVRTIIVDSTIVCRLRRSHVISADKIRDGDVIVGLASFGQATYEETYNSGMGSNGLTSARHDTLDHSYAAMYKESYDPAMPGYLVYCGKKKLLEEIEVKWHDKSYKTNIGKLLLSPTRTYFPVMQEILRSYRPHIHAAMHCSGGGQTKVLHFVDDLHITKDNLFDTPPVFNIIQQNSGANWEEMYKVFNMGHRLELYVPAEAAQHIIGVANKYNIDAQVVGKVEKHAGKKLTIKSKHGEFEY